MTLTRRQLAVLAVPVLLVAPIIVQPAKAILGFDIVYDPTAFAALGHIWTQDISNFAKLAQSVAQLQKIYTTGYQLYQSATYMQHSISAPMRSMWVPRALNQIDNITQSHYGEAVNWSQVVNGSGASAPGSWASASVPLRDTGNLYAGMSKGASSDLQAQLASIDIADGGGVQCLQTIGQQHAAMPYDLAALHNLGITIHSGSASFNALIQQLNMGNAVGEQSTTQALRQSQLQACLVQQQVISNKMARDQEVQGINTAIHTQETMNDQNNAWDGHTPWSAQLP